MPDLYNCEFGELCNITPVIVPVDTHTGTNSGLWVSMKDYQKCVFVVAYAAGTASDEVAHSINQASDNAGTGSKGVNFTRIRKRAATTLGQTSSGIDTVVTQSAASSYTPSGESGKQALYIFEVRASDMDVANSFDYLQLSIPAPSNTRLGCVLALLVQSHHPQSVPVSALS